MKKFAKRNVAIIIAAALGAYALTCLEIGEGKYSRVYATPPDRSMNQKFEKRKNEKNKHPSGGNKKEKTK